MLVKILLPLLVQVLTLEIISAQCTPCNGLLSPFASPVAGVPLSAALSPIATAEAMGFPRGFSPSFRTGFAIQSASPVSAAGLSIRSDNSYEGPLLVAGKLPFLSAVAVEGVVPSAGAGGVLYGCAAKDFGIVSKDVRPVLPEARVLPGPGVYSGRVL